MNETPIAATHEVINPVYHIDEYSYVAFSGTYQQCIDFMKDHSNFSFEVRSI